MELLRSPFIFLAVLAISCHFVHLRASDDESWDLWDDEDEQQQHDHSHDDHQHQHAGQGHTHEDQPKTRSQESLNSVPHPPAAAGVMPPSSEAQQAPPPISAAQQSGGNFASYNESCVQPHQNTGKQCLTSRGLVCMGGLCKCGPNPSSPNIPLTYVDDQNHQMCEPIASERNRFACTWSQQCRAGKYGYFSRCVNNRCTCFDTDNRGRPTMEHENVCYLVRSVGDSCEEDVQCNVTIPGEAICFGSRAAVGTCQCRGGYFEYEWPQGSGKARECLAVKSIDEACIADAQCTHNDGLGPLSNCQGNRCVCYDTENQFMKANVSYYVPRPNPSGAKGKCYFLKGANESCSTNEECILGYHPLAVCLPHPSYNGGHVCQCSQNEQKCNSGSGLFGSFVLTATATALPMLIGLLSVVKHIS